MKPHEFDEIRIKTNPIIPDDAWQEVLNRKMYNPKKITAQNSNKRAFSIQERLKQAFEIVTPNILQDLIKMEKHHQAIMDTYSQYRKGEVTWEFATKFENNERKAMPTIQKEFYKFIDIIDLIEVNWNKKFYFETLEK